ncbi:MAG: DUF4440 domain-containing protein [Gemmatimonadaceae bacterium]|nr:DUF4440 domain-containing protein [Gemmatimonadaceae bacterium]
MLSFRGFIAAIVVTAPALACNTAGDGVADTGAAAAAAVAALPDRTAEAEAIRGLDQRWLRAVQGKHVDSIVALYTPDAATLMPGQEPVTSADGRRAMYTEFVKMGLTDASMNTMGVEFSDDGTMAYDYGTYAGSMNGPDGKPMKDKGSYLNVWRRTGDGWKMVAEMSNSSMPMPAPATPAR